MLCLAFEKIYDKEFGSSTDLPMNTIDWLDGWEWLNLTSMQNQSAPSKVSN